MLAYVFSHRAGPNTDAGLYEETLRGFHASLAAAMPRGFIRSLTYRSGSMYSDWYLVEDSAALDAINEAAVTGGREAPHHAAARMAVDGVGKLLSLVAGRLDLDAGNETRFSKPPGVGYPDLYAALRDLTQETGASLWRRMMVLGPPPEFTLLTRKPVELPSEMRPEAFSRAQI
jgi:hypothetical protein